MEYILVFIAGFIWITRDIISIPETMNDSWFKRYKGNEYIDPRVSWTNKGNYHMILYPILSMFGDLYHLLGTMYIVVWVFCLWIFDPYFGFPLTLTLFMFIHGAGVWLGYNLWRKILN